MMTTPMERKGFWIEDAEFVVLKNELKPLIGRDLFEALEISSTQTLCSDEDDETVTPKELLPEDH